MKIYNNWSAARIRRGERSGLGKGGSGNGGWKGGISHKWGKRFKKNGCERCGSTEKVELHHKDRDITNQDSTNLETLCRGCHLEEHKRMRRKKYGT